MVSAIVRVLLTVRLPDICRGPRVVGEDMITSPAVMPPAVPSFFQSSIWELEIGISCGRGSGKEVSQGLLLPEPLWQYRLPVTVESVTLWARIFPVPPYPARILEIEPVPPATYASPVIYAPFEPTISPLVYKLPLR